MDQTNSRGSTLSGLVVGAVLGAAVGAGVALLCAPRSGRETRELMARKARELKESASRMFVQGRHTARLEATALAEELAKGAATL